MAAYATEANAGVVAAAELIDKGLALCRPDPGEKKPTYAGWPASPLRYDEFAEGDLFGILGGALSDCNRPGHSIVIADLDDPSAVARGDEFLPPTGMMDGRDGKPKDHRYFLLPNDSIPEWAVSTSEQGAAAALALKRHAGPFIKHFRHAETKKVVVDFLGTGAQVVCPSPGNLRRWVGGRPGEPAVVGFMDLWEAVCKLASACGAKVPTLGSAATGPNQPRPAKPQPERNGHANGTADAEVDKLLAGIPAQRIRRVLAYLKTLDPAVSGHGGHGATYWPARVVCWGFDLGEKAGFAVLKRHYNPRCKPEWTDDELHHKCHDADSLPFDKPRGWLLDKAEINLTDLGNARRVIARHGDDLRFVHPWKTWLVWDGRRWAEDVTAEAVRRVKETQGTLFRETAAKIGELNGLPPDDDRRKELPALSKAMAHALKWEDARAVARCVDLAKSEPGVPALPGDLDRDPWLFNVLNGTIDLRTGRLRPHRHEDMITKLAPVNFDPAASCPTWMRFLDRIMEGNGDLITYLQRVIGYGLTGDVSEQALWFFHGGGANGKSTFLGAILAMMGDYGMQAVSDLLIAKHNESHPTERADLAGKRFVATIETEDGKSIAEALMKQLTGGDRVRARKMRKDFFEFDPTHKIVMAANHKPKVAGTDLAAWRRIKLVPFTVTIHDDEKDKQLPDKLKAELPGILVWSVRGCLDWHRFGIAEPDEVRQATSEYQREQDTVAQFVAECCHLQAEAKVKVSALYEAYGAWSGDKYTKQADFNERMRAKGFGTGERTKTGYFWHGLALHQNGPGIGSGEPG